MKLKDLFPLRYKYLVNLRWSHTIIYLAELGILLFLLTKKSWIAFTLFLVVFLLEEYAYSKKTSKIEVSARIS